MARMFLALVMTRVEVLMGTVRGRTKAAPLYVADVRSNREDAMSTTKDVYAENG